MKVMTFLEKNADVTEVEPTQAAAEESSAADESKADGESSEETTAAQ
jgi:trigger factor